MDRTVFQENEVFKRNNEFPFKINYHKQVPMCAGCYFITANNGLFEDVYYVGSSGYLRARLSSHAIVFKLKNMGIKPNIYVVPKLERYYKEDEVMYIKHFNPLFNKTHKIKQNGN